MKTRKSGTGSRLASSRYWKGGPQTSALRQNSCRDLVFGHPRFETLQLGSRGRGLSVAVAGHVDNFIDGCGRNQRDARTLNGGEVLLVLRQIGIAVAGKDRVEMEGIGDVHLISA